MRNKYLLRAIGYLCACIVVSLSLLRGFDSKIVVLALIGFLGLEQYLFYKYKKEEK